MRSWPKYAVAASLLSGFGLGGCRITNQDHCGNQQGDATCAALDPTRPYCSECEADHNGCVATLDQISPECRADDSIADADTTSVETESEAGTEGSTEAEAEATGTEADTEAEAEAETETETGTDTDTETTTETETGDEPVCGNGILEAGEDCDGVDFGDATCDDPYGLPEGNLTCVPNQCVIDTSQCCLANGEVCVDGECCNDNCNLITNKCGL